MSFLIHLLLQQYNYMFYLGLLVPLCTHTEGPHYPRPVLLFTLNHRVFCPLSRDRRPSSRTVVPRSRLSSLVPDRRPLSQTVVPRPGPSSFVLRRFWHFYSRICFGRSGLVTYFTLVVPMFYLFITPSPTSEKEGSPILVYFGQGNSVSILPDLQPLFRHQLLLQASGEQHEAGCPSIDPRPK